MYTIRIKSYFNLLQFTDMPRRGRSEETAFVAHNRVSSDCPHCDISKRKQLRYNQTWS